MQMSEMQKNMQDQSFEKTKQEETDGDSKRVCVCGT